WSRAGPARRPAPHLSTAPALRQERHTMSRSPPSRHSGAAPRAAALSRARPSDREGRVAMSVPELASFRRGGLSGPLNLGIFLSRGGGARRGTWRGGEKGKNAGRRGEPGSATHGDTEC